MKVIYYVSFSILLLIGTNFNLYAQEQRYVDNERFTKQNGFWYNEFKVKPADRIEPFQIFVHTQHDVGQLKFENILQSKSIKINTAEKIDANTFLVSLERNKDPFTTFKITRIHVSAEQTGITQVFQQKIQLIK